MGFNKIAKEHAEPPKEKKFVPSTKEDLKNYAKAGRRAKRARQKLEEKKREISAIDGKIPRLSGDALKKALLEKKPFKVYSINLFNAFVETCKDLDIAPPRYRSYLDTEHASQNEFVYELHSALSRMSWVQLLHLLHTAVTTHEKPIGVTTRTWSEAHEFALRCLHMALGIIEKKGSFRLADPEVISDWPVSERKRKSKEDKRMDDNEEDIKRRNAALQAAGKDDDDDDDDDDEDEDDEGDDEDDEDEEAEDEDEEEEKKPARKTRKKKSSKDDDNDDDDEEEDSKDDDEGDDEDDKEDDEDEDEKPAKKKRERKFKSKSRASRRNDDDEPEDDDDDAEPKEAVVKGRKRKARANKDDDDTKSSKKGFSKKRRAKDDDDDADDEDEKPARRKSTKQEKSVSSKVKSKKSKGTAKADKAEKRPRAEKVSIDDKTVLSKVKDRDKGGPKSKLLGLIPKKGIAFKKLLAAAKEEGLKVAKVKSWSTALVRYGYAKAA